MTPYGYRNDAQVPAFPDDHPIIVFDGHCAMCSRFARFILRHDRRAVFRLMAAQSPVGQALYRHLGLDPTNFDTYVLLQDGRAWFKSQGTARIFRLLGMPWSALALLRLFPSGLLDRGYDVIARNRMRWFGRNQQCFLPDPAQRDRFIG
jgi:predicted DCC family thiol-disulfide oxidoreductase YuxK